MYSGKASLVRIKHPKVSKGEEAHSRQKGKALQMPDVVKVLAFERLKLDPGILNF